MLYFIAKKCGTLIDLSYVINFASLVLIGQIATLQGLVSSDTVTLWFAFTGEVGLKLEHCIALPRMLL